MIMYKFLEQVVAIVSCTTRSIEKKWQEQADEQSKNGWSNIV